MTASWNTPVEQWLWQRRAAGELVAILAAHRDLPAVAWTVAAAGCTVAGQVNAAAAAGQVRATFAGWRAALGLPNPRSVLPRPSRLPAEDTPLRGK
ncbi:MAG TPA: hypothetical protein VHN80_26345, partial [Kineosporiaceae bacterium]|nr:hypothetical protein [Kineosporiaceae bacterium]